MSTKNFKISALISFLIILAFFLSACKSDVEVSEDPATPVAEESVPTQEMETEPVDGKEDTIPDCTNEWQEAPIEDFVYKGIEFCGYIDSELHQVRLRLVGDKTSGTVAVSNVIFGEYDESSKSNEILLWLDVCGTYTLDGNMLTIKDDIDHPEREFYLLDEKCDYWEGFNGIYFLMATGDIDIFRIEFTYISGDNIIQKGSTKNDTIIMEHFLT